MTNRKERAMYHDHDHDHEESALLDSERKEETKLASDYRHVPQLIALFQCPADAKKDHPNYDQNIYDKFLDRCMYERKTLGFGNSGAVNAMYRFWCYYLRKHFIESMYDMFRKIALEDANAGARYGLECLFRFYSYGLEYKFRPQVFNDFQTDTLSDYNTGQLYGLEKFWAFLAYYGVTNQLELNPELQHHLSNFKCMEDFRTEEKLRGQHYSGRRKQGKKSSSRQEEFRGSCEGEANGNDNKYEIDSKNANAKNQLSYSRTSLNINNKRSFGDFFPVFKVKSDSMNLDG